MKMMISRVAFAVLAQQTPPQPDSNSCTAPDRIRFRRMACEKARSADHSPCRAMSIPALNTPGFTLRRNTLRHPASLVAFQDGRPKNVHAVRHLEEPEQHGTGGAGSGAIAASTVPWKLPNDFHKVSSNVGSFVNTRRACASRTCAPVDKKPIRAFLADGHNDNSGVGRHGVYDEKRDWF